jgi:hypothetical protein
LVAVAVSDTTGAGLCAMPVKKYQLRFFNKSSLRRNPFSGRAGGNIFITNYYGLPQ